MPLFKGKWGGRGIKVQKRSSQITKYMQYVHTLQFNCTTLPYIVNAMLFELTSPTCGEGGGDGGVVWVGVGGWVQGY